MSINETMRPTTGERLTSDAAPEPRSWRESFLEIFIRFSEQQHDVAVLLQTGQIASRERKNVSIQK